MATYKESLTGSFGFRLPPEWGKDSAQTNRFYLGLRGGGKVDAQMVVQVEFENRELNRQTPNVQSAGVDCRVPGL